MVTNRLDGIDMDSRLELEKVDIIFENCEYISVPANQIRCLIMRDTHTTLSYSEWNKYHEFKGSTLDCLQIYKEWLKENHPRFTEEAIDENITVYDRIVNYSDITQLELYWLDSSNSEFMSKYYLPWNDESEYDNKYQQVKENEDEDYIEISVKTDEERKKEKND